jgi:hypothetical protein
MIWRPPSPATERTPNPPLSVLLPLPVFPAMILFLQREKRSPCVGYTSCSDYVEVIEARLSFPCLEVF